MVSPFGDEGIALQGKGCSHLFNFIVRLSGINDPFSQNRWCNCAEQTICSMLIDDLILIN